MRKLIAVYIISALMTAAAPVAAQDAAGEILTLNECITTAFENNPELHSLDFKTGGKKASLRLAKSHRMPKLSVSETASRTNSPVMSFMSTLNQESISLADMSPSRLNSPDPITNFNTKLSFQLPIYNGRKVSNGITMAQLDRDAASLELTRKKQEVKFNVFKAYYDVILARQHLEVTEDAYRTAEAHVRTARSHLDAGTVVKSDVLSAEVRFAEIKEMRLSAKNNLELAKANLLFRMGVAQDTDFDIESPEFDFERVDKGLGEYIASALENRAEIAGLEKYVGIKKHMADLARGDRRPSLNLMAEYNLDNGDFIDNDGESWLAGVNLSFNIFDGGRAGHSAAKSLNEAKELSSKADSLRDGIELQVRQAYLDLKTAGEKIDVSKKALEQAEEALRIVDNRYTNGLTTIVELLGAETNLTKTKMRHTSALRDYAVGLEKLRFAAGIN